MPRNMQPKQWTAGPYEVDELATNEKSHISEDILATIPTHIFIARFNDGENDKIKTTIMPWEIWTLHQKPEVIKAIRAIQLEAFFRLPQWGIDYMPAHELMSSIQYDGQAMLTDKDGSKDLEAKKIDNEKKTTLAAQFATEATLQRQIARQEVAKLQDNNSAIDRLTKSKEAAFLEAERVVQIPKLKALMVDDL
ncbi:hypothetical protein L7F22_005589 [Adiantum nelumboides]|nr:hypothetical protein [Adiantum nelumboides]